MIKQETDKRNHPHPLSLSSHRPPRQQHPNLPPNLINPATRLLILTEDDEMLFPDPPQPRLPIVLIAREPQLSLLRDDIEDFALHVRQVRIPTLAPGLVDAEFEEGGADEEDGEWRLRGVFEGIVVAAGGGSRPHDSAGGGAGGDVGR